jgi:hypothetical protein
MLPRGPYPSIAKRMSLSGKADVEVKDLYFRL